MGRATARVAPTKSCVGVDDPVCPMRCKEESPSHGCAVPAPFRQGGLGDGGRGLRSQCAHWLRNDIVFCKECGTNPGGSSGRRTPTHRLSIELRRGRRLPTVVPTDSRPLSWPPIGALPRNRLASSATGGASPISPTPRFTALLVTLRRGDPCGRPPGLVPHFIQCVIAKPVRPPGLYRIFYNVSLRGRNAPVAIRPLGPLA